MTSFGWIEEDPLCTSVVMLFLVFLCLCVGEKERSGKHRKLGVKRKQWVLAQPPYFLQARKREAATHGGTI